MPGTDDATQLLEFGALGVLALLIICVCASMLILGLKLGPRIMECWAETNRAMIRSSESNIEVSKINSDAMAKLSDKFAELDRNESLRHEHLKTSIKSLRRGDT